MPPELAALPPGPTPVLAQTVAFHRWPLDYLRECQAAFGDVFTLRLLTARPLAVVADPEAVATLLEADPGRAESGAARRRILPFADLAGTGGRCRRRPWPARLRLAPGRRQARAAPGDRRPPRRNGGRFPWP